MAFTIKWPSCYFNYNNITYINPVISNISCNKTLVDDGVLPVLWLGPGFQTVSLNEGDTIMSLRMGVSEYSCHELIMVLSDNPTTITFTDDIVALPHRVLPGDISFASASCQLCDSLVLVELYDSLNGPTWTISWDLQTPVSTWYGVTLSGNNCVVGLNLTSNNLNGQIPASIGELNQMEELMLSNNPIYGSIPPEIGCLYNLRIFELLTNNISDTIPHQLGKLSNLEELSLGNSDLTGNIPVKIGNLSMLINLRLIGSKLTGPIPFEIGKLTKLKMLLLADNDLNGELPTKVVSGSIHPVFGNLTSLEIIDLENNQFVGLIPSEIGTLPLLSDLRLGSNLLNGCFPSTLLNYCDINVDFSNNPDLPGDGDFDAFCSDNTGICLCTNVRVLAFNGYGSLADAVECASPGDTITFDSALKDSTILLRATTIDINKPLYFIAPMSYNIVISNAYSYYTGALLQINDALSIEGLKLVGQTPESMVLKVDAGGSLELKNVDLDQVTIEREP